MSEVDFIDIIGDNLRSIMDETGMSQNQLAKELGVSRGTISKYINKQCLPSLKALANICIVLECDLEDIVPLHDMIQ